MQNLQTLKPGTVIKNGDDTLTVIAFYETPKANLALLIRHEDGLFVTVRDIGLYNGGYVWNWGHYISEIHDAVIDYDKRISEL